MTYYVYGPDTEEERGTELAGPFNSTSDAVAWRNANASDGEIYDEHGELQRVAFINSSAVGVIMPAAL